MIQRYDMEGYSSLGKINVHASFNDDGGWVLYSDVEKLQERVKMLEGLLADINGGKYKYYSTYEGEVETPTYYEMIDKALAPQAASGESEGS